MRKIKYLIIVAVLITVTLSSCGFVSYVKTSTVIQEEVDSLNNKKKEYINKLDENFNESNYYEKEKKEYLKAIIEAKALINECNNIENLEKVYNENYPLLDKIKTKDVVDEETKKEEFESFITKSINEISNYVDVSSYRENEANIIKGLIDEYVIKVKESDSYESIDEIVRDYKIKIYDYKTDKDHYNEELTGLINTAKSSLDNYFNFSDYRENERKIIQALITSFNNELDGVTIKEDVNTIITKYELLIEEIKTSEQLYSEEKQVLLDELFDELKEIVDYNNLDNNDKAHFDDLYDELSLLPTKENIKQKINAEKLLYYEEAAKAGNEKALVQYQLNCIEGLNYYLDNSLYREEQQLEIKNIINNNSYNILLCSSYNDTITALNEVELLLDDVLTNDEMWEKEDEEFFMNLHNLYGDDILTPPSSMTKANDHYELANIIDYYAFYKADENVYVRDKFRVNVNYDYNSVEELINEVYYYSELLCNAVIIKAHEDEKTLKEGMIIIELISVPFASSRIAINDVVEYNSLVCFDNKTNTDKRDDNFDNFAYKNYNRKVVVWNSEQLWYALENKYYPLCVNNSIAELILQKAEEILRNICNDQMGYEEKIFNIYKYLAINVQNGWFYSWEEYKSSSGFLEGSILDGVGICQGATKAYLLLLSIEGIEAKIYTANQGSGSKSHRFLYVKSNGYWYHSEIGSAFIENGVISYQYMLNSKFWLTAEEKNTVYSSTYSEIYKHLTYKGHSVYIESLEELDELLKLFDFDKNSYINILLPIGLKDLVYSKLSSYVIVNRQKTWVADPNLFEFIIFAN